MSKQNDKMVEQYESALKEQQLNVDAARLGQQQQELVSMEQNSQINSINEQLDTGKILKKMYDLLMGNILKPGEDGSVKWMPSENNDLKILSDDGVNYIMTMLQSYLTENTLLSNYDDKQINAKMEDISTTITDDIFMEYDTMFYNPTIEDCKTELKKRIQNKIEIRSFALELMDKEVDKDAIEKQLLKEIEGTVERELEIIRQQKTKSKLKRFESLIRIIQDTIHSAYQRAWKGQERTSARSHLHISETKGGMMSPQQSSGFNPLGILGRR